MDEEIELAPEAGLEVVQPEDGQDLAQPDAAEVAPEDEKTRTQKRRERERAARERAIQTTQEAQRAAAEAQAKLDRIRNAGASDTQPTADEYPDPIEHAAALAVWKQTRRGIDREAGEAETAARVAQQRAAEAEQAADTELGKIWAEHVTDARTRYADFAAVVERPDLPIGTELAKEILQSEAPADLAYEIAKNPDLLARLNSMNAVQMAREIGRIEAKLSAPRPRTATNAPEPITPVRGGASAFKDPAKMTAEEYAAWRSSGGTFTL